MKEYENLDKELELNLNLMDKIFEFYPEGIACKNADLKYISMNAEYCKIFNIKDSNTMKGKFENKFLSKQNQKLINDADREVKESRHSINYIIHTENNQILNITTSPILNQNNFCGVITEVKDITQEEFIKEEFVNRHFKYISREKNLQVQRETYVASIGHDLKNPTIAQIRSLELLLKGAFGEISEEQKDLLSMILDSCRYMNGMLSSLLDTYRNYGGAIKLQFSEFSMLELVNECVSEMLYVARDKMLDIKLNSSENCFIYADKVQIRRVIMNLLSNAIKYAYKNTELELNVINESKNVIFEFKNRSPYIPDDKQENIFARYVSYADAHKELGIGLGLYASKKIIESHNGIMYVKSSTDDRNTFGFKIPLKQPKNLLREVYL